MGVKNACPYTGLKKECIKDRCKLYIRTEEDCSNKVEAVALNRIVEILKTSRR